MSQDKTSSTTASQNLWFQGDVARTEMVPAKWPMPPAVSMSVSTELTKLAHAAKVALESGVENASDRLPNDSAPVAHAAMEVCEPVAPMAADGAYVDDADQT